MSYPAVITSWTTKTNKVDIVDAAHINAVQTDISAIETTLGVNPQGSKTDLVTRLAVNMGNDGTINQGTSFPGSPVEGQMFWRTDSKTLYVYSAGASAWQSAQSLSNVLFQYQAIVAAAQETTNASLTPATPTVTYRYMSTNFASGDHYIIPTKWKKIAGINTITVYAQNWVQNAGISKFIANVGGVTGTVSGTNNQTSPEWNSLTLDVSGLTNGTVYDVQVGLNHDSASVKQFLGTVIAFGS